MKLKIEQFDGKKAEVEGAIESEQAYAEVTVQEQEARRKKAGERLSLLKEALKEQRRENEQLTNGLVKV